LEIEDDPELSDHEEAKERRITKSRGSNTKNIGFAGYLKNKFDSALKLLSNTPKMLGLSRTKRESRKSRTQEPKKKKYKYLTKIGKIKRSKKQIPRWAVDKQFLLKFSSYMKSAYDAELFLGHFDGSKQGDFSIAEMFDYKTNNKDHHLLSNYFQKHEKSDMHDPIDIRGSSANWNNERFTTARRVRVPAGFLGDNADSPRLMAKYKQEYSQAGEEVKKAIDFKDEFN
jgi:hypothetical protein